MGQHRAAAAAMECRDLIGECSSAMAAPSSLSLITNSKLRDSSDLAVLELLAQAAGSVQWGEVVLPIRPSHQGP